MYIKYQPKPPSERPAITNIGEFLPGIIRQVSPDQEKEARRLIDNGQFIEATLDEAAAPTPEPAAAPTEAPKPKRSRSKKVK